MNYMQIFNTLALFLGAAAVISTAVPAVLRSFRAWETAPVLKLEIEVKNHVFVIDPRSSAPGNLSKIEEATRAVREAVEAAS